MREYDLKPGMVSIGLNSFNTMGVMTVDSLPENKRTKTYFNTQYLKEWADAVEHCYGEDATVEVLFHKDAPMVAREKTDEDEESAEISIGVAPQLPPDKF